MFNTPVVWKSYKKETINRGYWDQAMLEDIFDKYDVTHLDDYPDTAYAIVVVIAARHHADMVDQINADLARYKHVLLILTGDEEAVFPYDKLAHPSMKVWIQTPHMGKTGRADRLIPNGWPPQIKMLKEYKAEADNRKLNWFFAGQVTHSRREKLVKNLRTMTGGQLIESPGFTKGIPHNEYYRHLANAKVAPCPSGAVIPDSFRLYEALEAGCLPIADGKAPNLDVEGYWEFLFGERPPFPILDSWKDIEGHVQYHVDVYPRTANRAFAWWQRKKLDMIDNLQDDLRDLDLIANPLLKRDDETNSQNITVLVPTSPIKMHPDTTVIEETIKSIRDRLPNSRIILMFDGVREEQADRRAGYEEYIRRVLWLANWEWSNVYPMIFDEHTHQAEMTRQALRHVRTDTILFVEHDTPLCEDIPFRELRWCVASNTFNVIRLHHEALILPDHKHMMLDSEPQTYYGIPILRTAQWSQRPHVASTDFYRRMLDTYFTDHAKTMIEDGIHGKVAEAYRTRGLVGWNEFKVGIYAPKGDMKRSYHTDARGQDSKFDETFIY